MAKKETTEIRIVITEKKKSFVGKRMKIRDNSYMQTIDGAKCGGLSGKVVEIISEPFKTKVGDKFCGLYDETCVYVRSLETGLIYRTMFRKKWIIKNHDVQKYGVIGRRIILSDGSHSKGVDGTGHIYGCEKAPMILLTEPFVDKIKSCGNTYRYLCVIAKDLRSDKSYRVLFNEQDLVEENPYAEIPVNVTINIK